MRRPKPLLIAAVLVTLAFLGGFAVAKAVDRTAAAGGLAGRYQQVLSDLQGHYYKPVDLTKADQKGIAALLKSLHDPYSVYFTPKEAKAFDRQLSGSYTGVGTAVDLKRGRLTVVKVFPSSPAAQARITPGEVIVSVNGVSTAGKTADASVARIVGPAGTTVRLQLRRRGRPRLVDVSLTRRVISVPLTTSRMLNDHGKKVGYVALSSFSQGAGDEVRRAIVGLQRRGAQALVFDLRDNGGGLVNEAVGVAGDFLPSGKVVVSMQGLHSAREVLTTSGGTPAGLPLVVLVNGNTASASEIVTGALQDLGRATVIGTQTFGKGVVQTVFPLSGGAELKMTIASYRTPLGRDINHKGIRPDIVVKAVRGAHADLVLTRALSFIASGQ
jgi:carboxyl-terminal processing protease